MQIGIITSNSAFFIIAACGTTLFPAEIVNRLLLPVILIFMLLLINKAGLGEMKNSLWMHIVACTGERC